MAVACTLPVPCSLVLFARLSHRCALALPLGTRTINAWDTLEQTSDAKGNAASSGGAHKIGELDAFYKKRCLRCHGAPRSS